MFEEEVVDRVAGRSEILPLKDGANIVGHNEGRPVAQNLLNPVPRIFVPGKDNRKLKAPTEPGSWIGRPDILRQFHHV